MKQIELTKGYCALVDDDDFDLLSQHNWCAAVYRYKDRCIVNAQADIKRNGKKFSVQMHRFLMGIPDCKTDHRDGNGLNNQRENLRLATHQQNIHNRRKHQTSTSVSMFKGVTRKTPGSRWKARIMHNGVSHDIGLFTEESDAALAYNLKAEELFGEFACFNRAAA